MATTKITYDDIFNCSRSQTGSIAAIFKHCGVDLQLPYRLFLDHRSHYLKFPKKLNIAKLHGQVVKEVIQYRLNKELEKPVDVDNISAEWHKFSNTVYTVLKDTLGTPSRKHQAWFDDQDADI